MCAINGVTDVNEALVDRMNQATKSRGPDGSRVEVASTATFGHNRLSIIDLNERSSQPMHSSDRRYSIVFNGEIYNYRELRQLLEGEHTFTTEGDTEVLLAGYQAWGLAVVDKLRGIFAFALFDHTNQELIMVRDHMGVKPLYYCEVAPGVCAFSSELKGVLAAQSTRVIDPAALAMYMAVQYVPSPHSLVSGIQKVAPGEVVRFKNGSFTRSYYWQPTVSSEAAPTPTSVYETINQSVTRQLVSDRPLGVFLSGGIDSSLILHHVASATSQPKTFSIAFEMVPGFEHEAERFNADSVLAAQTAAHYGSKHTTFTITLDDIRKTVLNTMPELDEPIANPTVMSQYLLSQWVRDEVVVALGGEGGDELFGGYPRHKITMLAHYYQKAPGVMRQLLSQLHPNLKKLNTPLGVPMHERLMLGEEATMRSVVPDLKPYSETIHALLQGRYDTFQAVEPIMRYLLVDRSTWLADEGLTKLDKASMAHGLEVRVPLLDLDIVTMMDKLSATQKFSPWQNKKIIRDTYADKMPAYIFNQPKRGWISPGAKWLRDEQIYQFAQSVFSDQYYDGLSPLIDWLQVQRLLEAHVVKESYHLYPLWHILQLQVWAKHNQITV